MNQYKHITKEKIRQALAEMFYGKTPRKGGALSITDLGNGLFQIKAGEMTAWTNRAGVEEVHKALREDYENMNREDKL